MKTKLLQRNLIKTSFLIAALLCSIRNTSASLPRNSAAGDTAAENYLELRGVITGARSFLQEAEILVYEEDGSSLYITDLTNRMGRSILRLPLDRQFTIVVSKPGFASKSLLIDTHKPESGKYSRIFKYAVELFEPLSGLDSALLSKPVTKVLYSPSEKCFVYDEEYTMAVNEQLRQMYEKHFGMGKAAEGREAGH